MKPLLHDPLANRLGLAPQQIATLKAFEELALGLNIRLNLYSDRSTREFWTRHIRHSLTLAIRPFPSGTTVVDWGTGGGLPGIPLAVVFPETTFVLVDSVAKKSQAVRTMARRLGLMNVEVWNGRAEHYRGTAQYAVSRATARLADLWRWTSRILEPREALDGSWPPGLLALKGRNIEPEIAEIQEPGAPESMEVIGLGDWLGPAFDDKVLVAAYVKRGGEGAVGPPPG